MRLLKLHRLARLIALVVLAGMLLPTGTVLAGGYDTTLTGTVDISHGDNFVTGTAERFVSLVGDGRRVLLSGPGSAGLVAGQRVEVHGRRTGRHSLRIDSPTYVRAARSGPAMAGFARDWPAAALEPVAAAAPSQPAPGPLLAGAPAAASGTIAKRVAVLLVNTLAAPATPWMASQVSSAFFTDSHSVAAYYAELSDGQVALSGDVFGWYTLDFDLSSCDWYGLGQAAYTAASAGGVALSGYTNIVFAFPWTASCGFGGLAYVSGALSWLNGAALTVSLAAHELGHNFGAHHASTRRCYVAGQAVTYSSSCADSEYGDPFDVMGYGYHLMHGWHRIQLGYLSRTADALTIEAPGTYSIVPLTANGSTPRVARVARGDGTYYYLELRLRYGQFDSFGATDPVQAGVLVRLGSDTSVNQSYLYDATPSTSVFTDAAFAAGRTFADSRGISITINSVSPSGATFSVAFDPDTTPPGAPAGLSAISAWDAVTLKWTATSDDVAVVSYVISRDGTELASVAGSKTAYRDISVATNRSYTYGVRALDGAGNAGPETMLVVDVPAAPPPGVPTGLTLVQVAAHSIGLTWKAPANKDAISGYRIYAGAVPVADVGAAVRSYIISDVAAGVELTFSVSALNVDGLESALLTKPFTLSAATPPAAPTGLTATARAARYVALAWSAPLSTGAGGVRYRVFRDGVAIATVAHPSFTDRPAVGRHVYRVRALDSARNASPYSARVTVRAHR